MARWQVHLVADAERDFGGIIEYTVATFGGKQAKVYETTLTRALLALCAGPDLRDSVARPELAPDVRSTSRAEDVGGGT